MLDAVICEKEKERTNMSKVKQAGKDFLGNCAIKVQQFYLGKTPGIIRNDGGMHASSQPWRFVLKVLF